MVMACTQLTAVPGMRHRARRALMLKRDQHNLFIDIVGIIIGENPPAE